MEKKLFTIILIICMLAFIAGCGANSATTQSEDAAGETEVTYEEEPAAEGYETIGGLWMVGGIYYNNRLIDVHDNAALYDLYDSVMLSFNRDGSFMYANGWIYTGEYTKSTTVENSYLLTLTERHVLKDGKLVAEEYSDKSKDIITMIDENTFQFSQFDAITGKAAANDEPLLFVKDNTVSSFIDANKIALEKKDSGSSSSGNNNIGGNDSGGSSSSGNTSLTSYEGILNTYTQKMEDEVPRLVSAYKSESSGIYNINSLAEICNDKVGELAEICNEGIGLMADLMIARGDSYDTYETWADRLMDNYTDIADEIMDAYLESATY